MGLINCWEQQQLLMLQCLLLPFSFLFYFLGSRGYLTLTYRYVCVAVGGCVLAVVTMGMYSTLLFTSAVVCSLLVFTVDPRCIHPWVFGIQMLWQTFWHLFLQYKEYYQHEPVSIRLFLAVSSLMLLTQRITSVSMDLQDRRVVQAFSASSHRKTPALFLPLIGYMLNFTTLLGGPLCSYTQFVSFMEGLALHPPPNPLGAVFLKLIQVVLLEQVRICLVLKWNTCEPVTILGGSLWVWGLALVFRIQYYTHWRISECLNNAAGLGFWENISGGSSNWSGLSDGDFWTTETSSRVSQFARRWNATTALWLRRLVYTRCTHLKLFMTFGFSLWWHGLHLGHFVGFLTLAATVKADYCTHRYLYPKLKAKWTRLLYTSLSWMNTQMIITCVVTSVELRNIAGLRLLSGTCIGLAPLLNIVLLTLFRDNKPPSYLGDGFQETGSVNCVYQPEEVSQ